MYINVYQMCAKFAFEHLFEEIKAHWLHEVTAVSRRLHSKAGYRRGASHTHRFANHFSPVLVGSAACTEYTSALPSGSML